MRNKILSFVCFSLFIFISGLAKADSSVVFYGEPTTGLGYTQSSFSADLGSLSTITQSDSGVAPFIGMNLGWQVDYVHIILSSRYGQYLSSTSGDATMFDYGFGFGWEWNIPLMTSVIYRVTKDTFMGDVEVVSGSGLEISLSYFITERFKINASYCSTSFDVFNNSAISITMDTFQLGVSFPFKIPYPEHWWRER